MIRFTTPQRRALKALFEHGAVQVFCQEQGPPKLRWSSPADVPVPKYAVLRSLEFKGLVALTKVGNYALTIKVRDAMARKRRKTYG